MHVENTLTKLYYFCFFFRKNQRALKLSTLVLLDVLVKNYAAVLTPANLEPVLLGLPPLITESDLHIAQLNMSLLSSVARLQKGALPIVTETSLPEIFRLAQSPLLQGKGICGLVLTKLVFFMT